MQEPRASSEANPYAAPEVAEPPLAPAAEKEGQVTPRMVLLMRQSASWVLFFGVVGFLFTAFFTFGLVNSTRTAQIEGSIGNAWTEIAFPLTMALLAATTGTNSVLFIRYGLRIRRFADRPTWIDLASAFTAQRTLWRSMAIGLLLVIVAMIGLFIALIVTIANIADQA